MKKEIKRYQSDITRDQFERIRPLLESARKKTRPRTVDLFDVFNGVLYILKTGCQWRMLPKEYPKWRTVHEYFSIWREKQGETKKSILEEVLKKNGWRGATTARPPSED
jgi:transposase